jgi:hypothetical protein
VPANADIGVEADLRTLGIDLDEDGMIAPQESGGDHRGAIQQLRRCARRQPAGVPLRPAGPVTAAAWHRKQERPICERVISENED